MTNNNIIKVEYFGTLFLKPKNLKFFTGINNRVKILEKINSEKYLNSLPMTQKQNPQIQTL